MTPLHGIASRHDLPLPFGLVVAAGGIVLVVTFWVALFAWRRPRFEEHDGKELPRLTRFIDSPAFSWALRAAAGVIWVLAAAALVFGVDRIDNPAVGFIYVWLWVGIVVIALLFGAVHRRLNPTRLIPGRAGEGGGSLLPGALALAAFLYLELVQPDGATLPVLRVYAALWLAWVAVGVVLRGRSWVGRAEPFEVYSTVVARLSPWSRSPRGMLLWLNPLRNLASWRAPAHLSLVASVLLGGTLFDALSNTAWWVRSTQELGGWIWPLSAAGLACSVALVHALFWLATRPYGPGSADRLAPGLVPLVVGYALSHYGTMLYLEGQRTAIRFNDPLGQGWNLFGFAEAAPSTTLFGFPMVVAIIQVLLIVGGHVLGVLVTHDIALRNGTHPLAVHLPLLSVMVVFTMGGLLLMFGA